MTESSRSPRGHWIFAAFYRRLCDVTDRAGFAKVRASLLADATGDVLEIGAGTGGNLPHYVHADRVFLVEPDPAMRKTLAAKVARAAVPAEIASGSAEQTPYADDRFDTVVATLVFCTVDDLDRAAAEAKRVLKPGGTLLFVEHVGAGEPKARRTQERVEPAWKRLFGGCHLTRDPVAALERAGFTGITVDPLPVGRASGPARPIIRGSARA
ncbi:class I SAM-dependent methyltransferase [Yinghuangia soli]|uniref:Methyltransferase domain-containing protein n=1 Tax=Yinghuangia soli TaxID=2908204 RepID=A0AA41PVW8_9ACTN|nr:class I SAM-dependent methyltransferase [Yinghuangia soli]MCF2526161.1 methyltransferase domain-containing protein [Yinghuangia soli]